LRMNGGFQRNHSADSSQKASHHQSSFHLSYSSAI
jgi:hypothetical protein